MTRKSIRIILWIGLAGPPLGAVLALAACNWWVVGSTRDRIHDDPSQLEGHDFALVLGTSPNVAPDRPNLHFENRLAAARDLVEAGKVERLLVSGHRDSRYYDETRDMIARLGELGVPASRIVADNMGARTLESVRRAKEVYGLERVVIVSDGFHVGRALFIADRHGLEAVALRSAPVGRGSTRRTQYREWLARVKAVLETAPLALGIESPKPRGSGELAEYAAGRLRPAEGEPESEPGDPAAVETPNLAPPP